jgi:hypothetical protein
MNRTAPMDVIDAPRLSVMKPSTLSLSRCQIRPNMAT